MDIILKNITLLLFLIWMGYWSYTWIKTEKEKPQEKKRFSLRSYEMVSRVLIKSMLLLLIFQLLGWVLYPFAVNAALQLLGVSLTAVGLIISIMARRELGSNWAASYDYQIKNKQELVKNGIYKYVRHPIYTGISLMLIGGELVVSSYLVFVSLLFILGAYMQGKKEESLLESHFGKEYADYKKKTKMFVPFLW